MEEEDEDTVTYLHGLTKINSDENITSSLFFEPPEQPKVDKKLFTKNKFYVDNKQFLELLIEYKKTGVFSEDLGEIFFAIVKHLAYSRQFINYSETWKNEMISDALYNIIRYARGYDLERKNPFAYFSTVTINAFIARIKKEKFSSFKESENRKYLYDSFLTEYKLHAGCDIDNTDDSIYLEKENVKED